MITAHHEFSKAGLMIRDTLDANSAHAAIVVTSSAGVQFLSRATAAGSTVATTVAGIQAPCWVKLVRDGNTFTGYRSSTGTNWTQIGSSVTIPMTNADSSGLCVTSHNDTKLCDAIFSNLQNDSFRTAATVYWDNNGATPGFGTAAGTWAAPTAGNSTQGWSEDATAATEPVSFTTTSADLINFGNGATGPGAGTITISGTVKSGNMNFASGSGAIVLSGGQIDFASTSTVTVNTASSTINSILGGAATGLTKAGAGTLALTALNTWGGSTTISQGTLMLGDGTGNSGGIGNRSKSVAISAGATLDINRTGQTAQGDTTALGNNADISGGGSIRMRGGDTGTGTLILWRANTFTGGITLNAGTLMVGGSGVAGVSGPLGNGGTLTLNGGAIDTSNATDRTLVNVNPIVVAGSFAFGGTANLKLPGAVTVDGTRTITLNGSKTLTLAGNVTNGASVGALTKAGTGTLRLAGTNTYTGATAVGEGTLELVGGSQASPVIVSSGAVLGFTLGSPTTSTSTVTFDGASPKVTVSGLPAAATLMTASSITGTPVLDPAISGYALAIEDGGTTLKLNAVASESYDTWATANAVTGGEIGDSDNDGVKNLIEYALVDGGERGVLSGNTITFTKRGTPYGSDLTYGIEGSTSLSDGSWTTLAKPPVVETAGEISYIFTRGAPEKLFVRLKVTRP